MGKPLKFYTLFSIIGITAFHLGVYFSSWPNHTGSTYIIVCVAWFFIAVIGLLFTMLAHMESS